MLGTEFSETLLKILKHQMWDMDSHRGDQILIEFLLDITRSWIGKQRFLTNKILERLDKSGWDSSGYGPDGGAAMQKRPLEKH